MRSLLYLALLVACDSSDGSVRPDSVRPIDAPIDAFDACTDTSVKLTVTKDGVPQAGVPVMFGHDTLTPGMVRMTDAAGSICEYVAVGYYDLPNVTALNPFGPVSATTDELFSFWVVKPGDRLVLARTTPAPTSIAVTFPSDPGAVSYRLHTNCGGAPVTSGATVELHDCGATIDVLLESLTANGTTKSYLYAADVTVASTLDLTGTYQPAVTEQLSFDTLNVISPELGIHAQLRTEKGVVYDGPSLTLPISYMNNHPTFALVRPSIPGATSVTDVSCRYSMHSVQHFVDWYAPTVSHHFDLMPGGLFNFESAVTLQGLELYFVESGGHVPTDAERATIELADAGGHSFRWHMVVPFSPFNGYGRFPLLPDSILDYASLPIRQVLDVTLFAVPGGYDAIRPDAFDFDPRDAISGPSGQLHYATAI